MVMMKAKRFFKRLAIFVFLLLVISCSDRNEEQLPVDFVWDRVACELCKMALSDPRYSAQVIDHKGKAYYFDDIGCAILWLKGQPWKGEARLWVNDVNTSEWIEAKEANWTYGDPKTPMGYGFSATLAPVENGLHFQTVKIMMLSGKHLVNENRVKYLSRSPEQQSVGREPVLLPAEKLDQNSPEGEK